jgi:hypothetical protein
MIAETLSVTHHFDPELPGDTDSRRVDDGL